MPADLLSVSDVEVLTEVYNRDVRYWANWQTTIRMVEREGKHSLGLSWVILPYKPGLELPPLRRQLNSIYFSCLREYANQHGLDITICRLKSKLWVYDPKRVEPEWMVGCGDPI